jgi:hypothetical protein
VLRSGDSVDLSETLWLEGHILCIPVSDDYNLNDMEYVCDAVSAWEKAGG